MTQLLRQAIPYQLFMPQMQEVYVMPKGAHGRPIVRTSTGKFIDTTGSTTDGIQEAATYLQNESEAGGVIRIAAGDYAINTSRINYSSLKPISIIGSGWETKLTWTPATDSPSQNQGMINISGAGNADANHCLQATAKNLYIDFGSSRSAAYDGNKRGLNFYNCDNVLVEGCYLKGCRAETVGIGNYGSASTPGNRAWVINNYFYDGAQDAINPNTLWSLCQGNKIQKYDTGIEAGRSHAIIMGNDFDDVEGPATKVSSVFGFIVALNRMLDCVNDGTDLSSPVGVINVAGGGSGSNTNDGLIIGNSLVNRVYHVNLAGIQFTKGGTLLAPRRIIASSNILSGFPFAIYVNEGEELLIVHNRLAPAAYYKGTDISVDTTDNSFNVATEGFSFLERGFYAGMLIRCAGATSGDNNQNDLIISSVTASKIVVTAPTPDLVTESAGASITLEQMQRTGVSIVNDTDNLRNIVTGNHFTGSYVNAKIEQLAAVSQGNKIFGNFDENGIMDWAVDVVATASLPAAGAAQDGRILIEDNGTGDRNLIIYAGGQRFRIDGGAAI